MDPSKSPTAPKPADAQSSSRDVFEGARPPEQAREQPTVLSEVAYPGPRKEDLSPLNTRGFAEHQQNQVTIAEVAKGFRELGKDMTTSELLTLLLRALAKDETETLFEWVLWDRFKDNPPADGMGHW